MVDMYRTAGMDREAELASGDAICRELQAIAPTPAYSLDEFLDGATVCVFILDAEWRITYVNAKAKAELGRGPELIGERFLSAFPDARASVFAEQYGRAMRERVPVEFEAYYPPLGGWFEVKASPLSGGGLGVWFSNINSRRERDEALATVGERYRLASRATNDLLWDWDLLTNELKWAEAIEERFGYSVHALGTDGDWWLDHIHPDDRPRVEREINAFLAGGEERFTSEYRFMRADGTFADIFDRGYVIRGEDGQPTRMVGAMQDFSERKQALSEIAREKAHLATVFGHSMVGIMHCSVSGELLMVNQRFCEIVGRSEAEVRRSSYLDYTHPDDVVANKPVFESCVAKGEPFQLHTRYLRPDGTQVWCAVSVSFVRDQHGEIESTIIISQDISARKAAEHALATQSALLQNVIDSVSDLIFVKDRTGRFILTNRALDEGCGDLVGMRASEVAEFEEDYDSLDRLVMESGEPGSVEETIPIRGELRRFQTVKVPWVEDGEIAGVIGVSRDITERDAAEAALRQSELLYRSVLEGSPDPIIMMAPDGTVELINAAGLRSAGLPLESLRGLELAKLWPHEARDKVRAAVEEARRGSVAHFIESYIDGTGATVWSDVVVSPICDESGAVERILAIARDVTKQRRTADKLKWASEHDSLTQLPNRRAFQARLRAATIGAMASGKKIGLLLMDLDHFKHVNDTLGHAAGDELLSAVGARLKKSVRADDFVARLGGDEFAVILDDVQDEDALVRTGDSILARLQQPIRLGGRLMTAGASMGGALFPPDAESAHELFNNADSALYAMKESGRGGTKMFHQHMREQAHSAANQLSLARLAISKGSVIPYYQQKVDLKTGQIVGFEALLRWQHPRLGVQPPDTVAEAFKDYELASKIGELMQRGVFADVRGWIAQGLPIGTIAINAAPAEFLRDDYAERLLARMAEFEVPSHLVQIEVTEHVFLERGSEFVARALKLLNQSGVQIALDDFGTGYSSLSHLRDFPVDVVKVDQSFVQKMVDQPDLAAIVSAVLSLADNLGISVVAEGIETPAQLRMLQAKRCSVGQGYLFGRAVAASEVPRFLSTGACKGLPGLKNVA